ncbi:uncharacterized protein LOC34620488 [Cyclospora cayetanensis]|uniref:Uncharacterized protein LOC34620488 n=1 Tax=Cyclospora cayetanensis TaxID=88456 RepID=A0A6P6RUI6_9EIME|nr:uncharacterized protein LOC34620488 [Cyclospora cayetanensis]
MRTFCATLNPSGTSISSSAASAVPLGSETEASDGSGSNTSSSSSSGSLGTPADEVQVAAGFSVYLIALMSALGSIPSAVFGGRRRELGAKAQKLHAAGLLLQQQQQLHLAGACSSGGRWFGGGSGVRELRQQQQQQQLQRRFKQAVYMFCCFAIHPMRRDGTRLNSLLFNVGLLGISTCGAVLFSYNSFQRYARGTEAALCFGVQLRHLPFFGPLFRWHIFEYLLLGSFLLSVLHAVIYWCCCGKRRQHKQQQQLTFAPIPPPLLRMVDQAAADPAAAAAASAAAAAVAGQHAAAAPARDSVNSPTAKRKFHFLKGSSKAKQQQPLQQQEGPSGRRRIEFTEGPGAPRTYEREFGAEEKAYQTPKKKKWGLIEQD